MVEINLKKLFEKNTLTSEDIKRWFQSDAAAFLRIENVYDIYLEKYRKKYFQHCEEGTDKWSLNDKGKELMNDR